MRSVMKDSIWIYVCINSNYECIDASYHKKLGEPAWRRGTDIYLHARKKCDAITRWSLNFNGGLIQSKLKLDMNK